MNNSVLDSELLPGFNIFRRDRPGKVGGGVLVAVKDGFQATRRCDLERNKTELLVVDLNTTNTKPVTLYTFYCPPGSTRLIF